MTKNSLRKLGDRLRSLRADRGFSQEELAHRAGMHRTYIGGIERGERNVSLLNIVALAQALGVKVTELLADVDSPQVRSNASKSRRT